MGRQKGSGWVGRKEEVESGFELKSALKKNTDVTIMLVSYLGQTYRSQISEPGNVSLSYSSIYGVNIKELGVCIVLVYFWFSLIPAENYTHTNAEFWVGTRHPSLLPKHLSQYKKSTLKTKLWTSTHNIILCCQNP